MESWQKLIHILTEIWVEEDIKNGKIKNEKSTNQQPIIFDERSDEFQQAA